MIRRFLLALLALIGLATAVAVIVAENRQQPVTEPVMRPAASPYPSFIAGAGLIEASTGNISIGSPVSGVAAELYVHVGDFVEGGEPLFRVDDRDLQAQLVTARAKVAAAEAALQQPVHQLSYTEELAKRDPTSVSAETTTSLQDQVAIAEASLSLARAEVTQLNMEIERYVVRAPMTGRVLRLDLRAGEYVDSNAAPLVLFGDDRRLFVRVNVDESDAPRFDTGADATAFVRGSAATGIALSFEYVEPQIVPKTSLTGRSTERTDTRVLQALYSFERGALPVYIGQQLDVFIEAPSVGAVNAKTGN